MGLIISANEISIFDCAFVAGSEGRNKGRYSIRGRPGYSQRWPTLKLADAISHSLGSDICFAKIRSWISLCEQEHEHSDCLKPARSRLPDRVIALDTTFGMISLRLLITKGEPDRYIALSHRWGSSPCITTTSENLATMCENIDYTNLPQTFADAVVCAKNLGIKYLWIDSICVVQDDILDWQRQSAKMESYYSGAFVVIAAASADSGNAGFLKERPSVYTGIPFESSRAWCMQETILARRVLFFHHSEMLWQCQSLTDLYVEWRHGIVPLYTSKALTHSADRLPALSGLAAKVCQYLESQNHGDEYLAGIWRSDPLGLLWAVSRGSDPENVWEPDEYLGPSFSWVS
ncbi:HET-domain-containing protein, partial [Cenococcum geophilum 1.58]|uniref:HET-domain-containing protein n=1 Tax=Cenococcum geophilum 1.58 TaxID=794803 RepID=UPI00358EEE74